MAPYFPFVFFVYYSRELYSTFLPYNVKSWACNTLSTPGARGMTKINYNSSLVMLSTLNTAWREVTHQIPDCKLMTHSISDILQCFWYEGQICNGRFVIYGVEHKRRYYIGVQTTLDLIDFHCIHFFFKRLFVQQKTKETHRIWNDMRVSKWWQNCHVWVWLLLF